MDIDLRDIESFTFAAGETHVKLNSNKIIPHEVVNIFYHYDGDASLIKLGLVVNAIRQINGLQRIALHCPYFPGARQDRVCNSGEALSVKFYADFINGLNFEKVYIYDPHSDVTPALINNVYVHDNSIFVNNSLRKDRAEINKLESTENVLENMVLVSPDAGANKKIYKLADNLRQDIFKDIQVIRADKTRDTNTGALSGAIVYTDDLTGKYVYIIDDIISRGGTFMQLAKELKRKNAKRVVLIVSHHEGVANEDQLIASGIDKVYTTNSLPRVMDTELTSVNKRSA